MEKAIIYGLVSSSSLIIGALIGITFKINQKFLGHIMAFGAGVLVCTLSFDLMEEAYHKGGFDAVSIGFLIGGVLFVLGDYIIDHMGGHHRKQGHVAHSPSEAEASASAIALGAFLDGIPESIALGLSLIAGESIGLMMMCAIFLSNIPEAISSVEGFKNAGKSRKAILLLWAGIALVCALCVVLGFAACGHLSQDVIAAFQAVAAGAILAMVADTMFPEAYREGGQFIAIAALLGFLTAFIFSKMAR